MRIQRKIALKSCPYIWRFYMWQRDQQSSMLSEYWLRNHNRGNDALTPKPILGPESSFNQSIVDGTSFLFFSMIVHIYIYIYIYIYMHWWCNGYRIKKKDKVTRVQILPENVCIWYSSNTLKEGMNPIIPPPAMGK